MFSVKNKNILITGATSGIGLAVAKKLSELEANVFFTGRRNSGKELAKQIKATFFKCDSTKNEELEKTFKEIAKKNKLDALIINSGVAGNEKTIKESLDDDVNKVFEVNLKSVFNTLKICQDYIKDGSSIIITGSTAGSGITTAGFGSYSASKAGASYLGRTAAIELGNRNIRVNTICPGSIDGGMNEDVDDKTKKILASFNTLNRWGSIDEVVGTYVFLVSNASSFISGQEIRIDGGLTAGISTHIFNNLM